MRIRLTLLLGALMTFGSYAQLPRWVIAPANDTLFVKVDNEIIQGMANGRSTLWNMQGEQLYSTDNEILPFSDGMATVQPKGSDMIAGFIDKTGKFTELKKMKMAYNHPYFADGYLLCIADDKPVLLQRDGSDAPFPEVEQPYPFRAGYAPFFTYEQLEKKKDPHYGYFRADGSPVSYIIMENDNPKPLDPKEIDFASAIGSNGQGVAVIKNKLYWFEPGSDTFRPMLRGKEQSVKKQHLNLNGDYRQYFLSLPEDTIVIKAKYGKNQTAELRFDHMLRPLVFSFEDQDMVFEDEAPAKHSYKSTLTEFGKKGSYGLSFKDKQVLPPQFEKVGLKYGNCAFVNLDGKWGAIEILPEADYSLKINKGEDVAFRHQKYETQLRLDLPPQISAKEARVTIPEETGCLIDKTSREAKDTESGNFVTYDCVLNIPDSLPDTITTIDYEPVTVSYDGITLFEAPLAVKAWHLKYYNVDPIDSETSISNGVASFTININAQRNVGESDYPFDVKIEADDITVEYEKISETRYKCMVSNLQAGDNSLNIYVTEKGCPPSIFPFEIYYTKPVPKKKKKEEVVIRKKDPLAKKTTPRLEL